MLTTRRDLLKSSVALAMYSSLPKALHAAGQKAFAYVGTFTASIDGGGNGKGIYLFEMNSTSGELSLVNLAAPAANATWLSFDASGRFLYAVSEVGKGSVSAYTVDRSNGALQLLNTVSSEGAGPTYLSLDASGKYVFVADYAGGAVSILPVQPNGSLGSATYVHRDTGMVGPTTGATAPPGSFAISGHDHPHAHMIHADPSNRYVVQTDLGQDRIYVSAFDPAAGKLSPVGEVSVPPGDGPRHFVFHGNGRWFYSLQEEASTVMFFHFDPATGSLHLEQTISTLPPGFKGTSFTSEILFSPDGRFLYAVNRLHDSVAIFSLGRDGRLSYAGETSTMGDYPRHVQFDPSGEFLYACNQRSDSIASFHVDRKTGQLKFTGQYTAVGSPGCIVFSRV